MLPKQYLYEYLIEALSPTATNGLPFSFLTPSYSLFESKGFCDWLGKARQATSVHFNIIRFPTPSPPTKKGGQPPPSPLLLRQKNPPGEKQNLVSRIFATNPLI